MSSCVCVTLVILSKELSWSEGLVSLPLNELTIDLPPTKLPNPSSLRLLPSWVKFGAAGDLESYYNNLKLPVP